MKKALILGLLVPAMAFSQEITKLTVTNLTDKLNTRVEYDKSTGMDIRRLNLDSIHADKHKSRYTTLTDMSVKTPALKRVSLVKPLMAKDETGRNVQVKDMYVDTYAVRRLDTKNMLVDAGKTRNVLINDLSPSVFYLNDGKLSLIGTKSMAVENLSVNSVAPQAIATTQITVDSLKPYTLSLNDLGVSTINLGSTVLDSIKLDNGSVTSLSLAGLGLSGAEVTKLEANLLAVSKLKPTVLNVTDASSVSSILVIDNSKFNVEVTDETYAELAEMKLIYNFEQNYNESLKGEVKLTDVRKLERSMYIKWINLLASNKVAKIEKVSNSVRRKIVGEAWLYENRYDVSVKENMLKNLAFLKSKGYDTVLIRFDCTEDLEKLSKMVDDVKAAGLSVFMAYVGQDNLEPRWNPYIDPDVLEKYFAEVAPKCDGMLLNWRSTSNHVKVLPIEFFNYLCNTVRKHNDKILIYGEVYYGRIDPLRMTTLIYTAPENITGIVINNMGYYGYNTTYIVNNLFANSVPGYKKLDKLGQVIGYGPYYCSRQEFNAHLTLDQEYSYKAKVETAFRRTGYGTVTMLHDGVDDNQTSLVADPADEKHWHDTMDNILYDTKIWKALESQDK